MTLSCAIHVEQGTGSAGACPPHDAAAPSRHHATSRSTATLVEEGNALFRAGRFSEAADTYRQALELDPMMADAAFNLGCTADRLAGAAAALPHFERAVALKAEWGAARATLGHTLARLGRLEEALVHLRRGAALDPADARVRNNLGLAYSLLGKADEAERTFREALALDPHYAQPYANLSGLYERFGRAGDAIAAAEQALRLTPAFPEALHALGNALKSQGRAAEALQCYREALRLNPQLRDVHSSLLFALNYPAAIPAEEILAEHRAFGAACAAAIMPHANTPDPRRRIRLGYLSADFRDHAVSRFIEPALKNRDVSRFEVFCYSNVSTPDRHTAYLSRFADCWRDIAHLTDDAAEALIREDAVDILVDLSGHTAGNRLTLLARKPAPVQVTWIGYPQTTGIDAIDYRITDEISDPPGMTDRLHTETLLRLPGAFTCFQPPAEAPEVAPLPALAHGVVTFGSFNNPAKITPESVELWASVLRDAPGSRMLIKGYSLVDPGTRERLATLFADHGIPASRLILRGNTRSYAEHLSLYGEVDIALDTFPYNGTTTTCEALWMGVPVLTLAGNEHRCRVGATLLSAAGLPALVAHTPDEFAARAVDLAGDVGRLAELRASLRGVLSRSALLDGAGFSAKLEEALREIWEGWCAGTGADSTDTHPHPGPPLEGEGESVGSAGVESVLSPEQQIAAGHGFLAQADPDAAMRAFLAALNRSHRCGSALSGLEQIFNFLTNRTMSLALDHSAAAVGAESVAAAGGDVLSDTLLETARALLARGFVTPVDLLCRELVERGLSSAVLSRTMGEVAYEVGEVGAAEAHFERAQQLGDRSVATALALVKAREARRCREAAPARRGYLVIKAWGYGFWSDVSHLLGGLLLAELTGRTPVVHWGANSLFTDDPAGNAFDTFFEPLPVPAIAEIAACANSFYPEKWHAGNVRQEGVNVWDGPGSRLSALRVLERPEEVVVSDFHFGVHDLAPWIGPGHWLHGLDSDAVCRALFGKYLKVRPEIVAQADDFYRRRMTGRHLIAVHARGGDKGGEDPNLERLNALYVPYLARFLEAHREAGIFLITDDDTLLARFCERYGDRVVYGDAVRTASDLGVHYQQGASRYRLGREVLVDVLLALRCGDFLGNGLSNVSCAVAQLKEWQGRCTLLGARMDRMRRFTMYRS